MNREVALNDTTLAKALCVDLSFKCSSHDVQKLTAIELVIEWSSRIFKWHSAVVLEKARWKLKLLCKKVDVPVCEKDDYEDSILAVKLSSTDIRIFLDIWIDLEVDTLCLKEWLQLKQN